MTRGPEWDAAIRLKFENELRAIIELCGEVIAASDDNPRLVACMERIRDAATIGVSASQTFLERYERSVHGLAIVDAVEAVASMEGLIRHMAGEEVRVMFLHGRTEVKVCMPQGNIPQIVLALVQNACDAMPDGGSLIVETAAVALPEPRRYGRYFVQPGGYAVVAVSDTGDGMDDATKTHAFEPYFTGRSQRSSAGLGLTLVDGIVSGLGGFVTIDSEPGQGARVAAYIPLAAAPDLSIDGGMKPMADIEARRAAAP